MKIPLLFASVGTISFMTWSQAQPIQPAPLAALPSTQTGKQVFKLTLKNVSPSIMAYWLDPANHEKPVELQDQAPDYSPRRPSIGNVNIPLIDGLPLIGPLFSPRQKPIARPPITSSPPNPEFEPKFLQLPDGVDRIVAVDPQNALLIFGTPEGAKELEGRITALDKPLTRVELEARIIDIRRWDVSEILPDISPENPFQRVDSRISAALESHLKNNEASIIASPRVQGLDKLRATLYNDNNGSDKGYTTVLNYLPNTNTSDLVLRGSTINIPSQTNYAVQITPIINPDGTVTMKTYLTRHKEIKYPGGTPSIENTPASSSGLSTTIRDGETIAFFEFPSSEKTENDFWLPVVVLTARIVKPTAQ